MSSASRPNALASAINVFSSARSCTSQNASSASFVIRHAAYKWRANPFGEKVAGPAAASHPDLPARQITPVPDDRIAHPAGSLLACRRLFADPLFLLAELRRELLAEVVGLEHGADFDVRLLVVRVRAPLQPLDGLLHRLDLPEPETGDELLGLGERPIDDGTSRTRESHPLALGRRVQAFTRQENAGLDQLLVVLAHLGEQPLIGRHARFGRLRCLHNHHDTHCFCLLFAPASTGFYGDVEQTADGSTCRGGGFYP